MKRSFSESDSDEGDLYERSDKDSDGMDNENPEASARKRRRGQIEKKRRDRINSSLAELRQLVPAAIRKQGSTKLEKAEILQLTVEHLRGLKYGTEYNRGCSVMTRAVDTRITGHQECMAEGKPCLSTSADRSQTARLSPATRQIVNHLNWNTSLQSGHRSDHPSPPLTSPSASTTKTEPAESVSSSWQSSGAFLSCVKHEDVSKAYQGSKTPPHKRQEWGLSVALDYPSMFPLQTPSLPNVLHSPFGQAVPLIDWSMALITKTNISTPFRAPWAP